MTLAPGSRLGPYEVVAPIGAGGMGEVFKARDTRLDRSVAIKVLPAEFAQNAQLRSRFEREAKAISALNHPNICTLYDVGDGYLVMELLEGETLAERLKRGPLPLDQVIRIGTEIADALDRAHKAGIVHRDLKPSNVMLTKSGAKLLDFGLAAIQYSVLGPRSSVVATMQKPLTEEGTLIGTFQYMAPEQLEGGTIDARTDIFALGVLLYEMAAGKPAFEGKSKASLIASILTAEPAPISAVQPMTPASLDRIVRACLAKDPDERFQSAHDVATELRWIIAGAPTGQTRSRRRSEIAAWVLAALLAVIAGVAVFRASHPATVERPMRFVINPPSNAAFNFAGRDAGPVVVSPDGSRFAFVATSTEGAKRLYIRRMDSVTAEALSGTDGASYPFWSADGENLGFFADGKLKRVAVTGGAVRTLCDASAGRGGTWNREGTILFTPGPYDPLYRVSAGGGQASPLTTLEAGEMSHRWPAFFPDGHHYLYMQFNSQFSRAGEQLIYAASLDDPNGSLLMRANSQAVGIDRYVLYIRDSNLMAVPFDLKRLRANGEPFPIADHVQTYPNTGSGVFSASDEGVVAYQAAGAAPISHLIWYDRHGKMLSAIGSPDDYEDPRLSPDGHRAAVTRRDPDSGSSNIWIYDLATAVPTRFSYVPTFDHYPSWSPDGSRIVFDSNRNGAADIYVRAFGGEEQLLYRTPAIEQPTDWSPDGTLIVFQSLNSTTKWDLSTLLLRDKRVTPLFHGPANEKEGQISPDGKWIAFTSDESGHAEVYVSRFPSATGRWQISSVGGGGSQPRWRGDSREIFFLSRDRKMMAASVRSAGGDFTALAPEPLFQTRARYTGERSYDVSADGQKFLINTMVVDQPSTPLNVVVNWPSLRSQPRQ